MVRLIRSKGVGVYFVTQNPIDIPDSVLAQLGNRIQHALRAYTARDQKAVRAAAQTFRYNPELNTEQVITELGVGEALVSLLDEKGRPQIVQRTMIKPPKSQIGPINDSQRIVLMANSLVAGVYEKSIDRESAYEILTQRAEDIAIQQQADEVAIAQAKEQAKAEKPKAAGRQRETAMEAFFKSAMRSIGTQIGGRLVRGILGSLLGSK